MVSPLKDLTAGPRVFQRAPAATRRPALASSPVPAHTSGRPTPPYSLPGSSPPPPANLCRLAGGLRQLLGELGEKPLWHGGAGNVGVHDEHRHGSGETASEDRTGGQKSARCDPSQGPELRDLAQYRPKPAAAPPLAPPSLTSRPKGAVTARKRTAAAEVLVCFWCYRK